MEVLADRLAALAARVDQLETVVVAIGAPAAEELESYATPRVIERAAAMEARSRRGHADAARLTRAFHGAIERPGSFSDRSKANSLDFPEA